MKKIFLGFILLIVFISCDSSDSPNTPDSPIGVNEYSIIFDKASTLFDEQYALGVINTDGTGIKKIGRGFRCPFGYSVTDDGLKAVYIDYNSNYITLSDLKNLTDYQFTGIDSIFSTKVSPNGKYIAFQKQYTLNIFTMNIDGSSIKKIIPDSVYSRYSWSSDSKGIIFANKTSHPSSPLKAYYIDREGINSPVETENPFLFDIDEEPDIEYRVCTDFSRVEGLELPDTIGFYPYQFNSEKNKAYIILTKKNGPPPYFTYTNYLLGYDFVEKTEKIIIDTDVRILGNSWSPNDEDLAVFSTDGIEIVRVDGTRKKNLNISNNYYDQDFHFKWIPRID